eukprot:Skav222313  [mRNA]  locus=scaffold1249:201652:204109:- [translate_table: standard]
MPFITSADGKEALDFSQECRKASAMEHRFSGFFLSSSATLDFASFVIFFQRGFLKLTGSFLIFCNNSSLVLP